MEVSLHLILVALNKQKGKFFFQRLLCQVFKRHLCLVYKRGIYLFS